MKLIPAFETAWNDIEQAHGNGHLVNQSMLAFIFGETLRLGLPDVEITYDGRALMNHVLKPNLIIWQQRDVPGCERDSCESAVCSIDPFCCDTAWDGLCVFEAIEICVPDKLCEE